MDTETQKRLDVIEMKIDAIYISTEKTRTYFLWTLIGTAVLFIIPLIGLVFAIPSFSSFF